jgi:hypothetical protein
MIACFDIDYIDLQKNSVESPANETDKILTV